MSEITLHKPQIASLSVVDMEMPDLAGMSLSDLASAANHEHGEMVSSATRAVMHAIRCGVVLLKAREQIPKGQWGRWITDNLTIKQATTQQYLRLAAYRDDLLASGLPLTIENAMAYLAERPPVFPNGGHHKHQISEETLIEARRLRAEGMSWQRLGDYFGFTRDILQQRLDPTYQQRASAATRRSRRKRQAARKALERQQRDEAVRKSGGSPANAYSLIRRAAAALDSAMSETTDAGGDEETRCALRNALTYAHRAEDEIVRALKLERTTDSRRRPADITRQAAIKDPVKDASKRVQRKERMLQIAKEST